jgi:hypothetical protein
MPIRFRCAYCNQLMGIARRKAGTVVRCPTCAGQVIVPNADAAPEPDPLPGQQPAGQPQPLFEGSDFDQMFQEPAAGAASVPAADGAAAPPPGAWGTHAEPKFDVEKLEPPPPMHQPSAGMPPGIVLSPAKATLLTVLAVIALAVAFGAGFMVCFLMKSGS